MRRATSAAGDAVKAEPLSRGHNDLEPMDVDGEGAHRPLCCVAPGAPISILGECAFLGLKVGQIQQLVFDNFCWYDMRL